MKFSFAVFILLLSIVTPSYTDVIFPLYTADKFTAATTIQKSFSYEKRFGKSFSMLPRTSVAVFWPFYQHTMGNPKVPAGGVEIAVESRWYLFSMDLSKFFVGFYGGGALLFPSYATLSTSLGVKAGYKISIIKKIRYFFSIEPYSSISTHPVVHSTYYRSDELLFFPGAIVTCGLNLVSQWGKME